MFSSFKTSYIEANTPKDEGTCIFRTKHTHMRPGTHNGVPSANEFVLGAWSMKIGAWRLKTSFTCAWRMVLGTWGRILSA